MNRDKFRKELETLINCNSIENGSNTPDFMLAEYLMGCLDVYEKTIIQRENWYGRVPKPSTTDLASPNQGPIIDHIATITGLDEKDIDPTSSRPNNGIIRLL